MVFAPLMLACPLFAILVVAAVVLAISFGLAAIYVQMFPRGAAARKGADGPGLCGKCGYAVRGISTFQCPECGADLREVGIVPESAPPPGRRRLLLVTAGIFGGFMLTCCACGGLLSFFGRWNATPATTTTTFTATAPSGTSFSRTFVFRKSFGATTRPAPPPAPKAPTSQPADDE